MLDSGFLGGVREVWTCIGHVPLSSASEAKSFLKTFFLFFQGKVSDFYHVDVHGVGVFCSPRGRGKGLEGLSGPSASLGDLLCAVPLVLEMDHFRVPVIDFFWYSVKRHDLLHERSGDSSSKETDQDIMVSDASVGGVTLEGGDVTLQQREELPIFLGHSLSR